MADFYSFEMPELDSFQESVGHICVLWNHAELIYHQVFREILPIDQRISQEFITLTGNKSVATMFSLASEIYCQTDEAKSHMLAFSKNISILRENRNILLHCIPDADDNGSYTGVLKYRLEGQMTRFAESIDDLDRMRKSLNENIVYGILLSGILTKGEENISYASLQKPSQPSKLGPIQPLESL
jgi:hypothetical protein